MAWRTARSLTVLHTQLKAGSRAAPPATGPTEWGTIGDAVHDPTSDHSPHNFAGWGNQIVTAADFPNRPDLGLDAHAVLDDIRRSRDPRVKYGISNGQMFSSYATSTVAAWTWRPYNPKNGDRHFTHGHLSVVGDPRADQTQPWAVYQRPGIPEDTMTGYGFSDRLMPDAAAWRLAAAATGAETVEGGPAKGEPFQLTRDVHEILRRLDAIDPESLAHLGSLVDRLEAVAERLATARITLGPSGQ